MNLKLHSHINKTCLSRSNILHMKYFRTDYRIVKSMYHRNQFVVYRASKHRWVSWRHSL